LAKKKTVKKAVRKVARVAPAATKTKLLVARVRQLETKFAGYVPRAQLQLAMARYRAAMGRFNSEHNRVKLLEAKVRGLESRIEELKRESATKPVSS
jgi:hypothetical protein